MAVHFGKLTEWLHSKPARKLLIALTTITLLLTFPFFRHTPAEANIPYEGPFRALDSGQRHHFLPVAAATEHCRRHRLPIYASRGRRRRIYDLILLHNELDWLEIRLSELSDQVDYFIILESDSTFQGTEKPLHLLVKFDRFAKWSNQIVRRTFNASGDAAVGVGPLEREKAARNALLDMLAVGDDGALNGTAAPKQGDILLVGGVDELPRPSTLTTLRNCAIPARTTLRSSHYYYSFQWAVAGPQWPHPQATYFNSEATIPPADLRTGMVGRRRRKGGYFELGNAAWFCESCMPLLQDVMYKITSLSHAVHGHPHSIKKKGLLEKVRNGEDVFERRSVKLERVEENGDVPRFLRRGVNRERFAYMLDRDPGDGNFEDADADVGVGGFVGERLAQERLVDGKIRGVGVGVPEGRGRGVGAAEGGIIEAARA